ncbi:MAG TPA: hypothetical protein VL122_00960 [Nitrospirota bacterium]|nr:hypothetical protein [Nitrospirota bacterium]
MGFDAVQVYRRPVREGVFLTVAPIAAQLVDGLALQSIEATGKGAQEYLEH